MAETSFHTNVMWCDFPKHNNICKKCFFRKICLKTLIYSQMHSRCLRKICHYMVTQHDIFKCGILENLKSFKRMCFKVDFKMIFPYLYHECSCLSFNPNASLTQLWQVNKKYNVTSLKTAPYYMV